MPILVPTENITHDGIQLVEQSTGMSDSDYHNVPTKWGYHYGKVKHIHLELGQGPFVWVPLSY